MIKISCKVSEIKKMSIIWRHHLGMQINRESRNGIIVQNINTRNTSDMAKIQKN